METVSLPRLLGQTGVQEMSQSLGLPQNILDVLLNLLGALGILLVGWVIAWLVASGVRSLLKRTEVDNRLASMTAGQRATDLNIEGLAAKIVFWIIMVLAVVAALNVLNLTTVSQPLNSFLNQIFAYLPKVGGAAIMIAVAWLIATISRIVVLRIAKSFDIDGRLATTTAVDEDPTTPGARGTPGGNNQFLLSETLGNAVYWFVFLFFLPLILGILDLQGPLQPVQNLLDDFLSFLPNILKAIIIGLVGWIIARIVRGIVTNLLVAVGTDRLGQSLGLTGGRGRQSLSWIIGTILFTLILIPTAVAALEALQIESISGPASAMLNQILDAVPQIFTAALILVLGYMVGQFVKDLLTSLLTGIGFNNVLNWLGLDTGEAAASPSNLPPPPPVDMEPGGPLLIQPDAFRPEGKTPAELAGIVALVGIVLFAAVAATNVLGIPALTAIVSGLLVILGQLLVGLAIFAVGLYLANLAYNLVASSGSAQAKILGQTARISIIVLVSAMALQQIGLAPDIVNLAFGLLLGAICVAIALAFGLGGRDVAAQQLREWLDSFKRRD